MTSKKSTVLIQSILSISMFLMAGIISFSCGGDTKEEKEEEFSLNEDYYDFKGISLADNGIRAMIMLPDETANIGAATKPEIIHAEGDFKWDIHVGPNFHLHIEDYGDYNDLVEVKKKELKEYDFVKINYLINEKDLILYEQTLIVKGSKKAAKSVGVEHRSYHVYGQKTIDGVTYELRSRDEGYEKVIIELMAKSIKSFKAVEK
jgi:hypothetical protein